MSEESNVQQNKKSGKVKILIFAFIAVVLIGAVVALCIVLGKCSSEEKTPDEPSQPIPHSDPVLYEVNAEPAESSMGEVTGANGSFSAGDEITLTATPKTGYDFEKWEDGNTDNPRKVIVTADCGYKAVFKPKTFAILYKDSGDTDFSGTFEGEYPTSHTFGTETVLVSPTDLLRDFLGWVTASDGTGDPITSLGAAEITEDVTLYAVWQAKECLAAGTLITMADGTRKAVEDLSIGEQVRVFDHLSGTVSTSPLLDVWEYEEPLTGAFTLHFSDGTDVTVVGGHCFFERDENRYVALGAHNVADYVGHSFYHADRGEWVTLTSFTKVENAVRAFIVVTENTFNVIANGMLTNEDGIYTLFANLFDFGDLLTVDEEKMSDDIEKYGLWSYDDAEYAGKDTFDALNLQYMPIFFGKGLITPELFDYVIAYSAEIDPDFFN